jgi:uncharacterized membrane protein HdeD (DUF308 family)
MLSAMHKPLTILLVLFGLLVIAHVTVSLTVPYDPINSTGPGYFPVMALTVLSLACGVAVIVVGVIKLLRRVKPNA